MKSHSFLLAIFSVFCKLLVAVEQPTITLKEGLPAKIPCMVKGVADAYFWRKGENLNISDEIASIVFGVPGVESNAFRVTRDGTLMINNVTSAIEGRYFCRITTKDNEYFSDVMVLVQVLCDDFGFGIEECYPKETCTLQVEPYTTTHLTCTATDAPSSFSLKWYNGSEVITSVSSKNFSNKGSTTISEAITVSSEFGLPLTCEAIERKDSQTCGRFVHVRLNNTDTAKQEIVAVKSSARWIVPLVLLIVATVSLTICLYALWKKYTGMRQMLDESETSLEETEYQLTEKEEALKNKTEECKMVNSKLTEKDQLLKKIEKEFQQHLNEKDETLKKIEKEFQQHLTEKDEALKTTTEELKKQLTEKDEVLKKIEKEFQQQ